MEKKVVIQDEFWLRYRELIRKEMIPYQWNVLNDSIDIKIEKERNDKTIPSEKSHAIMNFKIAAGMESGHHYGWVFQDSDVYKWLEAVAYSLKEKMDEALHQLADGVVDLIAEAQEEDGYLSTYFTIDAPERKFRCLNESHELYCAGHFMEAAVAYYDVVKNEKVLQTACRLADCIDRNFGKEEGKIHGYDGHEEVEIGLLRLYEATGKKRYLELSCYFLEERGKDPYFLSRQKAEENREALIEGMDRWGLEYYQVHKPALEQTTAEGHAVRLVYLCTAMAQAALYTQNEKMLLACRKLWRNIVDKRMYITGGIGSTVNGEAFTSDYDLPDDTMYCETCASIGLIFFAQQMLKNENNGEYADVMERALYNTVLAGMALDGKHFFYVNPLEVVPEKVKKDPGKSHVKLVRPQWLGCACCPPNLARLLASVDEYVYVQKENTILANLFMNCESTFQMPQGECTVTQKTNYPWEGNVEFKINSTAKEPMTLAVRIPGWTDSFVVTLNGQVLSTEEKNGYIYIQKAFADDQIQVEFEIKPKRWYAHPNVKNEIGKTALSRGPLVYCLEGADNGEALHLLTLGKDEEIQYRFEKDLLGGVGTLHAMGEKIDLEKRDMPLYQDSHFETEMVKKELKWIPYYSWANRGENEMSVWVREHQNK